MTNPVTPKGNKKLSPKVSAEIKETLALMAETAEEAKPPSFGVVKSRREKQALAKGGGGFVKRASPNTTRAADKIVLPENMSALKEMREAYARDLPRFSAECLDVLDRDHPEGAKIIPCDFTESQWHIHKTIGAIEDYNIMVAKLKQAEGLAVPITKLPVHTVTLKARKVRASTYFRARAFWKNEFNPGHYDMVMAHEKEVARNLAEMMQRFHRGWVEKLEGLRTKLIRLADDLIEWEHDARTIVKTAGSKSGGSSQGFTYHYEQLSELSRYADGTTELASATTAASKYREIHIESTARGDNELKTQWDNAMWLADVLNLINADEQMPRHWNGYFRIFWAWWQEREYRVVLQQSQREYIQRTLDQDEVAGMDNHGWDLEQVQWRRDKLAGECSQQRDLPPRDYFRQEYPSSPEEAFVTKGRTVFERKPLLELRDAATNLVRAVDANQKFNGMPYFLGALVRDKKAPEGFRLVQQTDIRGANLVLWSPPEANKAYLVAADSAEGLEHGDDSVAVVYDRGHGIHLTEAARYIGKASGEELGEIVFYLHKLFNDAFVIGERNNGSGAAMCLRLVRLGCAQMYHHKDPEAFADREEPESFTAGFNTTPKTKKLISECMALMLRDGHLIIRHPDAIEQALSYQQNEKGRLSAPNGKKDDCVSADMLACFAHQPDIAPPVWTGRKNESELEAYNKMTPEQQLNFHYRQRIEKIIGAARDRNKQESINVRRAGLILEKHRILD